MIRCLLLACLLLPAIVTRAQKVPAKERADSLRHQLDSISKKQLYKVDSVKGLLRKFSIPKLQVNPTDTLFKSSRSQKADSIKKASTAKLDSLKNIGLALNKPKEKIDSVNNRLSSQMQGIQAGIDKKQEALTKPIADVEGKINSKLQAATNNTGNNDLSQGVNLPAIEQPKLPIPAADLSLPNTDLSLPNTDLSLPNTGLDKSITGKTPDVNLGVNMDTQLPNTQPAIDNPLEKIKGIDELKNATDKLDQVSVVTDKAKGYEGDLAKIKEGNVMETEQLPNELEKRALETDQLQDLNKIKEQEGEMLKQMGGQPMSEEQAKEQLIEQGKEMAIDHFAAQGEVLQGAMEKISTYKQKYSAVSSLEDLKKRPPNPLKGKPYIERLVPGISFQYQRRDDYLIDMYAYAGYKHTLRLVSGFGWNQRFARDKDNEYWNSDAAIFGPRAFAEYRIYRSFIIHTEGEVMNTFVPYSLNKSKEGNRQWVAGVMMGLKTEYKITRWMKGTVLLQYNLFNRYHKALYVDRLNSRFGFEFQMKKKKKQ